MKVYYSLSEIENIKEPICLSIGMFDGVHRGHQKLLEGLKSHKGSSVVLTFSNHPISLLRPDIYQPTIVSKDEKLKLLELQKIDHAIILPFSKDIAQMSYQIFLTEIHRAIPFEHLYVGEGDGFGKNREGTKEKITHFAPKLGFVPHYVEKLTMDGEIVSSTWIRKALQEGDIARATKLLGREPSFETISKGLIKPGKYHSRILMEGEKLFKEQVIEISEDGFELGKAGTVTLINKEV